MEAFAELERSVLAALETYSNVHRGSGHNSMVTTYLYEQARKIVIEYLGQNDGKYVVIFCTPRREAILKSQLKQDSYQCISSRELGLPLGVSAMAVRRKALPRGTPFQTGGGTTRLVSPGWVIWAGAPDKFEAGTPAIINVITFARALQLTRRFGKDAFRNTTPEKLTVSGILYQDELEKYSGRIFLDELRQTLVGRGILVPTAEGGKPFINLDNAASTPTFTPIWKAVCLTWDQPEEIQKEVINEVRSVCSGLLNAPPDRYDIIFTSNTTESINLAAESLSIESESGTEPVIVNTILEHTSNDLPWRMVPNVQIIRLSVDNYGFIDLKVLETLLSEYNKKGLHGKKQIRIVAVSGASNVLGICNNLEEISRIVHENGARLFVDGAQLVAHRKIEMERSGIDYLAFSAHKVYAPFGTGVLVAKKGILKFSQAEMELINLSGEENATGIAALGKSLILLKRIGMDLIMEEEKALTVRALQGLSKIPDLTIYGIKDPESPGFTQKGGVIVFSLKKMMSNRVAGKLAEQGGIGVRSGCHCAHILIKHLVGVPPAFEPLQGLIAKLFPKLRFPGLVRMSFGIGNSEEEIDTMIKMLYKIASQHRNLPKTDIKHRMNDFVSAAARKVYSKL